MTETEAQAHELVKRKEWLRAVELYDQLLGNALNKQISKERVVACLLGRSECCLELGRHEAVVSDCRRIIKLLADGNENSTGARARRRLVHALFSLRRFSEAEMATREWIALNSTSNNPEALKMLENLHTVLQIANGHKAHTGGKQLLLEEEIRRSLDAWVGDTKGTHVSCTYCAMTFRDRLELRAHCATEQHQTVIMSDEGRDWRWRAPPRGHTSDSYQLCEAHSETGACRYGAQCAEAHGPDELAEWRERFEYRRMRLQRATETELYGKSYTEQLLERWVAAASPERVMRERLDGVEDTCTSELVTAVSSKSSRRDWSFTLRTRRPLHAVALLQDAHRNHFSICSVQAGGAEAAEPPDNDQEWLVGGGAARSEQRDTDLEHRVTVLFRTDIYGTFRQSVVFDLGGEQPVLVKHLCVDVLPVTDADRIKEIKKEIALSSCERWSDENAEIVVFTSPVPAAGGGAAPPAPANDGEWERSLLGAYPCPRADSFTLTHSTVAEKRPTRSNYRARMHELLCVEEMARYEQVARYNLTAKLRVAYSYMLAPNGTATSTAKYSHSGELFALMPLGKDVSEDTSAGRLVLNSCTTVLVGGPAGSAGRRRVYEALIEDKGKSVIYLRLPARCVRDLQLKPDTDLTADVQFQLNRIPYCEWHYAIDKMHDLRTIFPDTYVEPAIPWTPARQWPDGLDVRLNLKQREAVVAITTPTEVPLPPILIIGPFGTGKTYTLAQAIRQILQQRDTRVLICTHSNSAADLYVKDYLHGWVEGGAEEARPLRVYYHRRWVATVHPTVQKYCLIDTVGGARQFRPPALEDLLAHRVVVVTLSISMWLSTVGLARGHFTHILLDEAAQAMECEAIMPLALADQRTRVVLAGDHMQLSPELFSHFAKERNMHVSLLERLYDHYPPAFPCKILLCENYRAHEAIIRFTSELFYDQKLVSSGRQPRHDKFYPLTFFTTRGEDVQDRNSTAFYNNSEVYELVERVCELRKRWPPAWGKLDDQSIGIMTPYADQVFRIRSELRKRRMGGISVERVLNVQGKQFRAVFLSTVRTRRTCAASPSATQDDVDYGFLSNSKLLNTAITRAQSLVAVVGDPVALCSIGRCRKVWERFIEICNQNKSLYGITWQLLRSQLDGVELKKTYVLNPLAPEFVPRQLQQEAYIKLQQQQAAAVVGPPPQTSYAAAQQRASYGQLTPASVSAPPPYVQQQSQPPPPQPVFFIPSGAGAQPVTAPPPPPHFAPPPFTVRPPPSQQQAFAPWGAVGYPLASPPALTQPQPLDQNTWSAKQPAVKPGQRSPQQQQLKPLVLDNGLMGGGEMQYLVQQATTPRQPPTLADKDHIQFFQNVHFPEQRQPTATELLQLLPPGFTPADMLLAPQGHQLEWCRHLQERHGGDTAQRFIDLLVRQQRRQDQQQPPPTHALNGMQQHKQMYLRDLDTSMALVALQQRDEAAAAAGYGGQLPMTHETRSVPWQAQQQQQQQQVQAQQQQQATVAQQSVPLYRRQGPPQVVQACDAQQMMQQHSPPLPPRHTDWQRQINAEFAAMNLGVVESLEEMLSRTYASVLRKGPPMDTPPPQQLSAQQQQPQQQQQDKAGDPFAVLRDLGQRSSHHTAGQQLYHYFS